MALHRLARTAGPFRIHGAPQPTMIEWTRRFVGIDEAPAHAAIIPAARKQAQVGATTQTTNADGTVTTTTTTTPESASSYGMLWNLVSVAGTAGGAYHGYKRNHGSIGWAIGWGLLGGAFPIITIPVAWAQGFGKPAGR